MGGKWVLWILMVAAAFICSQVQCRGRFERLNMCANSPPSEKVIRCDGGSLIAMFPYIRVNYSPDYQSSSNCSQVQPRFGLNHGSRVKAIKEARLCNQKQSCSLATFDIGGQKVDGQSANYAQAIYSCMKDENTKSVCDSFTLSTSSSSNPLYLTNPTQDGSSLPSYLQCTCNIQTQGVKTEFLLHYAHFNSPNSQCTLLEEILELEGVKTQETYNVATSEDHMGDRHTINENQITLTYQAFTEGVCSGGRFSLQVVRNPHVSVTCSSEHPGKPSSIPQPQPQTDSTTTTTTTTTTTPKIEQEPEPQASASTGQGSGYVIYMPGPTDHEENESEATTDEDLEFDFSFVKDEDEEYQKYLNSLFTD